MMTIASMTFAPQWLCVSFVVGVLVLLFVDLFLFGKSAHGTSRKNALIESALWIIISLGFNFWLWVEYGNKVGVEFLTGYLVEKSLSVDNLFVILLIFDSFKVPQQSQHRVLFYGILGAIVLRGIFILLGAKMIQQFHWIMYVFGGVLVVSAIKFLRDTDEKISPENNWTLKLLKRFAPISHHFHGQAFTIIEDGRRKLTPLFVALIVIEATDLIFAVDSIPAVFAVTQDAFTAFASNILAVLGLRALYFVLADGVKELRYLKPGLAAILGFIGIKMLIVDIYKLPSWVSLLVIFGILLTAGLSSWYVNRVEKRRMKHS